MLRTRHLVLVQLGLSILLSHSAQAADFAAQTDAWHQERIKRLKAEDGWLTLVGLFWLQEGASEAGSMDGAIVRLPATAPEHLGTFVRNGKAVTFQAAPQAAVRLNGKPFTTGKLTTDENDARPDVLRWGTLQLLVIVRGERVGIRIRDSSAQRRLTFQGIERFPADSHWRKVARFEPAPAGATLAVPNVLWETTPLPMAGTAIFSHDGIEQRLDAVREDENGKSMLFFVFRDSTSGDETYPSGRFLYAEMPEKGKVILDFNRAFNPPCAFTPYATCPLPPKQNRLTVAVRAGEKKFGEH